LKYKKLRESLDKHGQQYPIHRCKFGIIDGYKKAELLVGEEAKFVDHPEIETIEQYIDFLKTMQPVIMTAGERRKYIKIRGRELRASDISAGEVIDILKALTGASERTIYRHLPEEAKLEYKRLSNDKLGKKRDISNTKLGLISKIRAQFDWLDSEDIQKGLEDPLHLLRLTKQHYESLKAKPTVKASVPELMSVLYAKLEEAGFPRLDDKSMRWWKYLAEEYYKRYNDEGG